MNGGNEREGEKKYLSQNRKIRKMRKRVTVENKRNKRKRGLDIQREVIKALNSKRRKLTLT